MIDFFSPGLLGGHVSHRAHGHALLGDKRASCNPRQTEIHDFRLDVRRHHDVGTLDVPVYNSFFMGHLQTLGCLQGNPKGFIQLQRA